MPTTTSKLGLTVDSTSDNFSTAQIAGNWELIDASPGIYTNTTANITTEVAGWGASQTGMLVQETDGAKLTYMWNGTSLVRAFALGQLSSAEQSSTVTATSNVSPTTLVTTTCTIPAGSRNVEVKVMIPSVVNTTAATIISILDGATQLTQVSKPTSSSPGSQFIYVSYGPTSGSHTYTVEAVTGSSGSTSTFTCSSTAQIQLTVTEV